MSEIIDIPISPTLLRRFVHRTTESRVATPAITKLRKESASFVIQVLRYVFETTTSTKKTMQDVKTGIEAYACKEQRGFVMPTGMQECELFFPKRPMRKYLHKEISTVNPLACFSQEASQFMQYILEQFLREIVMRCNKCKTIAQKKTIQTSHVEMSMESITRQNTAIKSRSFCDA